MSVRDLASRVGLHSNTTREHLDQLAAAGLVIREEASPSGRGRPALLYRANPAASDDQPAYRALAQVLANELAEQPDAAASAVRAGERWASLLPTLSASGAGSGAVERLVDVLHDLGFAPDYDDREVRLRRCPFGSLARTQSVVVCGAHLGLMRGALKRFNAGVTAADLVPFVAPNLCVAHLEPLTARSAEQATSAAERQPTQKRTG